MNDSANIQVFVAVVGGLGSPQTNSIAGALSRIDGVRVWASSSRLDQFRADVDLAIRVFPAKRVVLVGHSFGAQRVLESCVNVARFNISVDYLALLDPVAYEPCWSRTLTYPPKHTAPTMCDIYLAANWYPVVTATVVGGPAPTIVGNANHNSLCRNSSVIASIVNRVTKLQGV